jgi:hypothetical protein
MFYDKEIEIFAKGETTKNIYGGTVIGQSIYIKTILGDVQPYSKELLVKEYGYDIQVSNRVFIDLDSLVTEGKILKYKNVDYEIKKIIEWDDYMELMIYGI